MHKLRYKAVIFDFDDTLVETRKHKWAHHTFVAKKFYNIDLTEETLLQHWGKPLDVLITELYQSSDTLEKMYEALISVRNDFLKQPYEGSAEMIQELINHGIKIAVLSATNKKYLVEDLIRLDFPVEQISVIQGADETKVHKPDPNVLLPILNKFAGEGISKKDIVKIGDSVIDLKTAKAAKIHFIAVTTGLYSKEDFKKKGAKIVVQDIREITKFLIA